MIFVNSMSDLFHEAVPFAFIIDVFSVMRETPQHIYQVLTQKVGQAGFYFLGLRLA